MTGRAAVCSTRAARMPTSAAAMRSRNCAYSVARLNVMTPLDDVEADRMESESTFIAKYRSEEKITWVKGLFAPGTAGERWMASLYAGAVRWRWWGSPGCGVTTLASPADDDRRRPMLASCFIRQIVAAWTPRAVRCWQKIQDVRTLRSAQLEKNGRSWRRC